MLQYLIIDIIIIILIIMKLFLNFVKQSLIKLFCLVDFLYIIVLQIIFYHDCFIKWLLSSNKVIHCKNL